MPKLPEIPGYRIVRKLGRGGMSTVYSGIQERLERTVAIKILNPALLENEEVARRFEKEASIAAGLYHTNIVRIFDTGKTENHHFIVMEYLEKTLKDLMKDNPEGKIHPELALDIVEEILQALEFAHFRGVYHRDIKPANIMFRQDGTAVVVDFGIARVFDPSEHSSSGLVMGTVEYMSPEQCKAQSVDGRTDIYALGIVLYEMLTGKKPYGGETHVAIALQQIETPIPRLPEDLGQYQPLLDKMVAKNKIERLSNSREFVQILDRILTTSVPAPQEPKPPEPESVPEPIFPPEPDFFPEPVPVETGPGEPTSQDLLNLAGRLFTRYIRNPKNQFRLFLLVLVMAALFLVLTSVKDRNKSGEFIPGGVTESGQKGTRLTGQKVAGLPVKTKNLPAKSNKNETDTEDPDTAWPYPGHERPESTRSARDIKFDQYLFDARVFLAEGNVAKARENLLLAQQIKTTTELLELKEEIENAPEKGRPAVIQPKSLEKTEGKLSPAQSSSQPVETISKTLRVKLRFNYQGVDKEALVSMLKRLNFFENQANSAGSFPGHYEITTVGVDRALIEYSTGLWWYDGEPSRELALAEADRWIGSLNARGYAGHSDWRLPTLEEAASLLRKEKNLRGLHITSILSAQLPRIWTRDYWTNKKLLKKTGGFWIVCFDSGNIKESSKEERHQVLPVRSITP